MKILLINPPHQAIGSRIPKEHLPPLGLLSIGGPLIDAGHDVKLLDADYSNLELEKIVSQVIEYLPDAVLMGHSGSSSVQPVISKIANLIKLELPKMKIIIGGVYPTFHWENILNKNTNVDIIVCGEAEGIITKLIFAIENNISLTEVNGIAFNKNNKVIKTKPAKIIENLDKYRVAWEFLDNNYYSYWSDRKAVVVQFSRGCPFPCSYCGQSIFWQKWRHRNPIKFAKELSMLYHKYGVEVINFADENPTSNKKVWKQFLTALIAENVPLILVGSCRADNIARDHDILHLYKKAGFERLLLGIENYDEVVLKQIKKSSTKITDKIAIELLRKHNILSMATYVVGFTDEKLKNYFNSLKQLLIYDPDQIQLLYVTPHKWTPYFNSIKDKTIVEPNQEKWDYKHQVLSTKYLKPWIVFLLVKLIEVIMQIRPIALKRLLFHNDKSLRRAMRWYYKIGRKVWINELFSFIFKRKKMKTKVTVNNFWN